MPLLAAFDLKLLENKSRTIGSFSQLQGVPKPSFCVATVEEL